MARTLFASGTVLIYDEVASSPKEHKPLFEEEEYRFQTI